MIPPPNSPSGGSLLALCFVFLISTSICSEIASGTFFIEGFRSR
jgi:hypothetical protein